MTTGIEIERVLATVAATLDDQQLDEFDPGRVQQIVNEALGGAPRITVDDGGGLHDEQGARIGAVRRTPTGEWIAERQNPLADRSRTAIPAEPEPSGLKGLFSKRKR